MFNTILSLYTHCSGGSCFSVVYCQHMRPMRSLTFAVAKVTTSRGKGRFSAEAMVIKMWIFFVGRPLVAWETQDKITNYVTAMDNKYYLPQSRTYQIKSEKIFNWRSIQYFVNLTIGCVFSSDLFILPHYFIQLDATSKDNIDIKSIVQETRPKWIYNIVLLSRWCMPLWEWFVPYLAIKLEVIHEWIIRSRRVFVQLLRETRSNMLLFTNWFQVLLFKQIAYFVDCRNRECRTTVMAVIICEIWSFLCICQVHFSKNISCIADNLHLPVCYYCIVSIFKPAITDNVSLNTIFHWQHFEMGNKGILLFTIIYHLILLSFIIITWTTWILPWDMFNLTLFVFLALQLVESLSCVWASSVALCGKIYIQHPINVNKRSSRIVIIITSVQVNYYMIVSNDFFKTDLYLIEHTTFYFYQIFASSFIVIITTNNGNLKKTIKDNRALGTVL